ncbi:uncharacterized protein LOC135501648 [Lineus longissimus]|uniref:uncharacterized protein LOC135501648 n=1 Tax=Lineus longissimus TaxID=88925 RepID=UPI00315D240D
MDDLKKLIEAGTAMGYAGEDLQKFVKEQQAVQRDVRALARQAEAEKMELVLRAKEQEEAHRDAVWEREAREKEIQHRRDLELIEAKAKAVTKGVEPRAPKPPKLPYFNETHDDMDAYLQRFERYAETQKWPQEQWAMNLSALLKGKALEVYARLPSEDALDFAKLKAALLIRFELTVEGFRKRFRTYKPEMGETFLQFSSRLKNYLMRWIEMSKTEKTFGGIIDLLLRDQLLNISGPELRLYLKERAPDSVKRLTDLADQYVEARGGNIMNVVNRPRVSGSGVPAKEGPKQATRADKSHGEKPSHFTGSKTYPYSKRPLVPMAERICHLCSKKGHIARDCTAKASVAVDENGHEKESLNTAVGSCCITTPVYSPSIVSTSKSEETVKTSPSCGLCMPVTRGLVGSEEVSVLRDTGCSGVIVRRSMVNDAETTGKTQRCMLADGTVRLVPTAEVTIDTPFFKGRCKAMCMENPVYDLIVGNIDGARDPTDPDPGWSLVHAVITRAQAQREARPQSTLKVPCVPPQIGDADDFKEAQQDDKSLELLRVKARDGVVKTGKGGRVTEFKLKSGLLYRGFHSPTVQNGKVFNQFVVPTGYRDVVMKYAHETLLAGHLGSRKSGDRLLSQFFWPGVHGDIARFCRSCSICQRTTPKGRTVKVPLGNMPVIGTPFQRVAIDLVGPISPPTGSGHRYILTLMDYATRYPEATALRKIDTVNVAEALLDMFSRVGIPPEVLSDLGTQFVSDLMKEVSRLLSFSQLTTTPYHLMCNGLVEKFNGTLKSMLRRMCSERPKDWDRYLSSVLFAYREAPQESLGFSPFELLYGRTVRGPMTILKEFWTKEIPDPKIRTTYQYVLDLKQRLEDTCEWAHDQLKLASARHKAYYNRKARVRRMKVGAKALVLLPTKSNKLLMQWKGPFTITEVVGDMDYRLNVHGKVKTFHANMLKEFIARPEQAATVAVVDDDDEWEQDGQVCGRLPALHPRLLCPSSETVKDVHVSDKLSTSQKQQVEELLTSFSDVLSDQPGQTTLIEHDIKTTTDNPVRVKQYPLPYSMQSTIIKEMETMLQMGADYLSRTS